MKTDNIDFSKLSDRIVEQAFEASGFVLNTEQRNRLLQNKIDRAREAIEHRKKFPAYADYQSVKYSGNEVRVAHYKHATNGRPWG